MHFFMSGLLLMYYSVISASSHDNSNQATTESVLIPIKDQLYGEGNNRQEFKHTPLDEVFHQFQAKRHQNKRSTGDSPRSRWSDLNDGHRYALIGYSGIINSEVIYVLTYDLNSDEQVISSDLHRSDDYGDSFDKISSRVSYATLLPSIHVNPSDHNKVFFIDSTSAKLYLSENEGASRFTTVYLYPATIDQSSIVVHPTEGDWLIARDSINNALYVSRDLGKTAFTKIATDVTGSDDFQWQVNCRRGDSSYDFDNSVVYFTSSNVLYTQKFPYNEKKQFSPSFTGIATGFLLLDRYIFVVDNYNKLWVSADRRPLQQAVLLSDYNHTQYHVSSINSMQVLVLARNSTNQYNMYLSDEHGVYYYLSLTNLVAESRTIQSYRLGPTIIDLVTLASTNYTTYIANQWVSGSYKRTLISFDAGVNWQTITDNETDCIDQSSCSLHFHIYTNKYWRAGIYSSESAPGIAIAHGTLRGGDEGYKYRDGDGSDLYITRDGGVTWTKTLSGTWLVNVLDHGSLLVAAHDHYTHTGTSRTLMYSCNEGQSWSYYRFTTQRVSIFGVITEPGETTTVVSLYGTPDKAGPREWSVFVVEFRNIFTHTCQSNDYYEWMPTDEHSNDDTGCFLGVSVVVERRKPDVCCYNSHTYIRVVDYSTCHCTREDYECDYGYKHANGYNGLCIRDDRTILSTSSTSCVEGESYRLISRGYRKIGGNGCSGGTIEDTFQHINITCCSTEASSVRTNKEQLYKYSMIAACAVLLILLLTIICLLCAMKCNRNRSHKPSTSNLTHTQEQLELSDHIERPYDEVVPVTLNSSYADNVVPHKDTKIAPSVLPPDYSKFENYSYPYPTMPQKKDMAEENRNGEKEMMRWRHPMEEEIIEKFDETEDSQYYY